MKKEEFLLTAEIMKANPIFAEKGFSPGRITIISQGGDDKGKDEPTTKTEHPRKPPIHS